jgi:hypothetical protein
MFEYKKQKSAPTYTQPTKVVKETKKVTSKECQNCPCLYNEARVK